MNFNSSPPELLKIIDHESVDFRVKSSRNHPRSSAMAVLVFSLIWCAFISFFAISFFGPLFRKGEVRFEVNDLPTVASLEHWEPMLVPGLIIGLFILIGLGMLGGGLLMMFQSGAYFVGTPTRFIKYRKGITTVKDWEQFSGNIKLKYNGLQGDLSLELRTGKMQHRKNAPSKFVPDIIHIIAVENVYKIEKLCRTRIKENDPTPVRSIR